MLGCDVKASISSHLPFLNRTTALSHYQCVIARCMYNCGNAVKHTAGLWQLAENVLDNNRLPMHVMLYLV